MRTLFCSCNHDITNAYGCTTDILPPWHTDNKNTMLFQQQNHILRRIGAKFYLEFKIQTELKAIQLKYNPRLLLSLVGLECSQLLFVSLLYISMFVLVPI